MAANPGRKPPRQPAAQTPSSPVASVAGSASAPAGTPAAPENSIPPGLRQALLAAVWCYVAALWLLALDQTFNWGIFGPDLPPAP